MRIAVVGLGKLGAPLAALLASRGQDVVEADTSADAAPFAASRRYPKSVLIGESAAKAGAIRPPSGRTARGATEHQGG